MDPRARELNAYWNKRGILTTFLGMKDDWEYVKNGQLGFDPEIAQQDIVNSSSKYDLILTHNEDGDYGHIHHKFVHQATQKIDKPKVYFASTFNYNKTYKVQVPCAPEELPLHQEVIEGFQDRNTGLYIVTPEAELTLKEKQ
jgi:LmbE family N-acetylglucosaminyl deacetylase